MVNHTGSRGGYINLAEKCAVKRRPISGADEPQPYPESQWSRHPTQGVYWLGNRPPVLYRNYILSIVEATRVPQTTEFFNQPFPEYRGHIQKVEVILGNRGSEDMPYHSPLKIHHIHRTSVGPNRESMRCKSNWRTQQSYLKKMTD